MVNLSLTTNLFWQSKSVITSLTDGNLTFYNNAGTLFNLLQLGGTTNLFPAIKRNGAAIDFRLADDSAGCNITASNFTATVNNATFGMLTSSYGSFTGSSNSGFLEITETANNKIRINTGTLVFNSTVNCFNGTTNLFPSIRRNGANLDFKLADNSDYAGIIYKTLLNSPTVTAGAVTFDCNLADIFAITLVTGTPTTITLSNARAGSYVVNLKQPAGGSATVAWATTIVWAGGTAPTLTTTANYLDIITLIYDGTTWRGVATLNFAS
jgi:hypothetical protein